MIEVCRDANHVFPIAVRFFVNVWVDWLVDALLEMVENGVARSLPDGGVEVRGVGGVDRYSRPIWKREADDSTVDEDVDVQRKGRSVKPIRGTLGEPRKVGGGSMVSAKDFAQICA